MGVFEIFGWVGAILFAVCAVPQAWMSYKQGHSDGISSYFIWSWFIGELCMIVYTVHLFSVPLLVNYTLNALLLLVIIRYKYFPRR